MIEIEVGPNLVGLGSFLLSWHGLFSFIAVASAVFLVGRWAPLKGIDPDIIYSIAIWAIIGGVIGARLVHVIDRWEDVYQFNPIQILYIWTGGIGLWGGILGGTIGGFAYAIWAKHPVGIIADLTAPVMLFSQSIGRLGDFVNGEHCAKPAADFIFGFIWTHPATDAISARCAYGYRELLNGELINAIAVQPVIAYEIIWNLLALVLIWKLRDRIRPAGMLFTLYLALYAVGRFAISFLRIETINERAFGLQESHLIAIMVLAITIPILIIKARPASRIQVASDGSPLEPPTRTERGTRAQRRRRQRDQ